MVYGAFANFRNWLFEKEFLKSNPLESPTISVGNITVGGTGKTPLVAYIAEFLADSGEKVCVLTRGYGRQNQKTRIVVSDGKNIIRNAKLTGDEPLELANKLGKNAIIIADANRYEAGKWAQKKFGVTAFVLDDAFQHRKVKRDLDLVCIDAANPFGNKKVLPFGILRESLDNLNRADAIIISRANLLNESQVTKLKSEISRLTNAPIFISQNKIKQITSINQIHENQTPDTDFFVFCAIGNPENFTSQLINEKFDLVGSKFFPDHHFYSQNDIEKLIGQAKESGAKYLITTVKDSVKLNNLSFQIPCYVAENKLIFDEEKKLHQLISAVFRSK